MAANYQIGSLIDARYLVQRQLGAGASGTVFLAREQELGRDVAIKVLSLGVQGSDSSARFEREAKALNQLLHPNIVRVYRFGFLEDGSPFIVMEFVSGESLRSCLERKIQLNCAEAVHIAAQLSSALEYAHSAGIVHRDLKPENVIISEDGTVKLLDFGLCKQDDPVSQSKTLTQTGAIIGTAFYMSPEQCMGKNVDWRSDIYSFACLLFEMITGAPPFQAETQAGVLLSQLSDPMPDILELAPQSGLPPELSELILKSGKKNREERYQSFAEISDILSEIGKLNCTKTFDRKAVEKNRAFSALKKKLRLPKSFLRNSAIALTALSLSLAFYLCCTESGKILLSRQAQNTLAPADAVISLSQTLKELLSSGKTEAAIKLIDESTSSKEYQKWSAIDREQLLQNYFQLCQAQKLEKQCFLLRLKLLDQLFASVQLQCARNRRKDGGTPDPPDEKETDALSKICREFYYASLSKRQWAQVSHTIESQWSLGSKDSFSGIVWLFALRCESNRKRGVPDQEASTLAKYYATAAGASEPPLLYDLVKNGSDVALKVGAYNRAVTLHLCLSRYYFRKGRIDEARKELALAEKYADGHGLSDSEKDDLMGMQQSMARGRLLERDEIVRSDTNPQGNESFMSQFVRQMGK